MAENIVTRESNKNGFPFLNTYCGKTLNYFNEIPTTIVRVNGTDYQGPNYDVFIGSREKRHRWNAPSLDMIHNLEELAYYQNHRGQIWTYRCPEKDPKKIKEAYARYLETEPILRNQLYQLIGKRLACDCNDFENCHGNVLVKKLEGMSNKIKYAKLGDAYLFYSGISTPLSYMEPGRLVDHSYEVGQMSDHSGKEFTSAYHMYGWKLARDMGESTIEKYLLREKDPKKIHRLIQDLYRENKFPWDQDQSIYELFLILVDKWNQDQEFRECCKRHEKFVPLLQGGDEFWCSGIYCEKIQRFLEHDCTRDEIEIWGETLKCRKQNIPVTGFNILGWLIFFVTRERNLQGFKIPPIHDMSPKLREGYEIVLRGLSNRHREVSNSRNSRIEIRHNLTQFIPPWY